MPQEQQVQAQVNDKKEGQATHQGVVEAAGREDRPKQQQVEGNVNGRKDPTPPAIIQPGGEREDAPFPAFDSIHLVRQHKGEGYKKEERVHIFTYQLACDCPLPKVLTKKRVMLAGSSEASTTF